MPGEQLENPEKYIPHIPSKNYTKHESWLTISQVNMLHILQHSEHAVPLDDQIIE